MQTLSAEKIHATNHYLDVIAKLNGQGSEILLLTMEEKIIKISFISNINFLIPH